MFDEKSMGKKELVGWILVWGVICILVGFGVNYILYLDCVNSGGEWVEKSWAYSWCQYSEWNQLIETTRTMTCIQNGVEINCSEIGVPEIPKIK